MSFVLDSSVSLTWCFDDERTDATDALLERVVESGAAAPALWQSGLILVAAARQRAESLVVPTERCPAALRGVSDVYRRSINRHCTGFG